MMKIQTVMIWVALCLVVASKPRIVTAALTEEEAKLIFATHNYIRSDVWPPAADMQLVKYSVELEERAEAWANLHFNRIHPNPEDYADVAIGIGYIYDTAGTSLDALEQILDQMVEPGDTYNYDTNECDGNLVHAIYIDFKKAFDSVPHQRLLYELRNAGIRGRLLVWIQSFWLDGPQECRSGVNSPQRTYFTFDGTIYEQMKGTPMGSPISGLIAEAVLQRLESLVFRHHKPTFWARYVDDTFVVIDRDQLLTFKERLNAVFPGIQFTMEEEENNQLSFLDVLICRKDCGELKTKVFRKATNTMQVLNFSSNNPINH
nr:unnamed protein product [Spirometra erinaceieuropaei]